MGLREDQSCAELHPYASESWFTAEGARKKRRRLEKAGLPDFTNWKFITLTVANRSVSEREAYELGKDRIRRFLARFRAAVGVAFKWCWKLEFHDDGYAHWHLLLDYQKKIPQEMFTTVEKWWGLGRINVRRVKGRDVHYVFKYVAKNPEEVPDWVARHRGRTRVFQASKGFYLKRPQRKQEPREPLTCIVRVDLFTRLGWDAKRAVMVSTSDDGKTHTRAVKLKTTFSVMLQANAEKAILQRRQLAAPGVINLNKIEKLRLEYEHKRHSGLAIIPPQSIAAA